MGLFSFLSKKKSPYLAHNIDLELVRTDIHSHLLPGIDDGSKSMEDSISMIVALQQMGYQKLICTPHVMYGYYHNSTEKILNAYEQLKNEVQKRNIPVTLGVSAEYNFDEELIARLQKNDIISFGNSDYNYLLFEFSYFNEPNGIDTLITEIFAKGYIPVLAHPERYPYFVQNRDKYIELKQKGVLFQININSMSAMYGLGAKEAAEWLIENEYIDFIGTDAHKIEHVLELNKAFKLKKMHDLVNSGRLMNNQL